MADVAHGLIIVKKKKIVIKNYVKTKRNLYRLTFYVTLAKLSIGESFRGLINYYRIHE